MERHTDVLPDDEIRRLLAKYPARRGRRRATDPPAMSMKIARATGVDRHRLSCFARNILPASGHSHKLGPKSLRRLSRLLVLLEAGALEWRGGPRGCFVAVVDPGTARPFDPGTTRPFDPGTTRPFDPIAPPADTTRPLDPLAPPIGTTRTLAPSPKPQPKPHNLRVRVDDGRLTWSIGEPVRSTTSIALPRWFSAAPGVT